MTFYTLQKFPLWPYKVYSPCTMGGGVAPGFNGTCGWNYYQWGPGMGSMKPSYSYHNWFPRFVPGEGQARPGKVSVGRTYNPVAVAGTPETNPAQGNCFPHRLEANGGCCCGNTTCIYYLNGVPQIGCRKLRLSAGTSRPAEPSTAGPSAATARFAARANPERVSDLAMCGPGGRVQCDPPGSTPQTPGAVCRCVYEGQGAQKRAPKAVLVDVRSDEETRSIPTVQGALHIPIDDLPKKVRELERAAGGKDGRIYVYCKLGRRAALAKRFLEAWGFTDVVNIGGTHSGPYARQLSQPARAPRRVARMETRA